MQPLSNEQIEKFAPSVFSNVQHSALSEKYRHIPTSEVLSGMKQAGFLPVMASQTTARMAERRLTNKHLLRFRHPDIKPNDDGEIAEVCLYNSHNGSSSYRLMTGIFRMVCSNGLIVMSESIGEVKVRHIGSPVDTVVAESLAMIEKVPQVYSSIQEWMDIPLSPEEQTGFAMLARAARPGSIEIEPETLIEARRPQDGVNENGSRSLWRTMNVIQENMVKGGMIYQDANNRTRTTRAIKAIGADELVNRRLWEATEAFHKQLVNA